MDAKQIIGFTIRAQREALGYTQERLAESANITYQYLSALENGRENFTIGVLESLSCALGSNVSSIVANAYNDENLVMDNPQINRSFLREVPLPEGLTLSHLADALNETQRVIRLLNLSLIRAGGRALPSYIQANNFSGIVTTVLLKPIEYELVTVARPESPAF